MVHFSDLWLAFFPPTSLRLSWSELRVQQRAPPALPSCESRLCFMCASECEHVQRGGAGQGRSVLFKAVLPNVQRLKRTLLTFKLSNIQIFHIQKLFLVVYQKESQQMVVKQSGVFHLYLISVPC